MALSYVFDPRKSSPSKPDFSFLAASLASRLTNPIWTFVVSSVSQQGATSSKGADVAEVKHAESEKEVVSSESGSSAAEAVAAAAPSTLVIDTLRRFRSRDIVKGWPNFGAVCTLTHFFDTLYIY